MLSVPVVLLFFSNCKKDNVGFNNLSFSTDTLTFDTVFATLGSTTHSFKVYNSGKKPLKIDNIQLSHLVGTQFRINVDGVGGDHFSSVTIPAKDSIYVFVEVTVNPNSAATPYVIIDNINFTIGGKTQTVFLQAFGQNAHFHYGEVITKYTEWNNDLPHVIIAKGSIPGVLVDCNGSLNIKPGCKVLFAGNSALFVAGTLNAIASNWQDSIVFRGARLEHYYDDLPGQWFGIVFLRSDSCGNPSYGSFNHCVINEASYGIYAGAGLTNNYADYLRISRPQVYLRQTIVKNAQNNAVFGFNAYINAENCLFYNSSDYLMKFGLGGEYSFNQCTMYNTGNKVIDHQKEVLILSNFIYDNASNTTVPGDLKSTFTNCVVYGSLKNEVSFNNYDAANLRTNFDNTFSYCLLKSASDTVGMFSNVNDHNLFNQDPGFKAPDANDFTPADSSGYTSPCVDYCPNTVGFDIFDKPRTSKHGGPNPNDIGAVEAQ